MAIGPEGEAQECCKVAYVHHRDVRRKTTKSETALTLKHQLFSKMFELRRETDTIVFLVENKNFDVVYPPRREGEPTMWDDGKSGIIGKVSSRRVDW